MGAKFDAMATKHEGEEKALIKLEGTVDECRADTASTLAAAREARDIVIERVGRRSGSRLAMNPPADKACSPPRVAAALIHRSCSGGARLPAQSGGDKLPTMRQATLIIMVLAAVGCVADDDDTDLSTSEASEEADSTAAPSHDPTGPNCPGGSGGPEPGGGPGGKPIPAPRDCTKEATWELCYACCDWNEKHSWGETCRRLPKRSRGECWRRLENELRPQCQRGCGRPGGPIITVAP
jgi:hypothetical protein